LVSRLPTCVDPALVHREFAHARLAATFWNGLGVSDDEQGAEIFVATGLRSPGHGPGPPPALIPERTLIYGHETCGHGAPV
jgi:hypothetical protein